MNAAAFDPTATLGLVINGMIFRSLYGSKRRVAVTLLVYLGATISVNLSVRQLRHEGLVGSVARILDETGLPPEVLSLEITEGLMLENAEPVLAKLRALKFLGIGLEIDDLGTGYSSFSYLRRLPVEVSR